MSTSNTGMYPETSTWNPFQGCTFDCVYCEPTFKRQAKRQKNRCRTCYAYTPHEHPDRLSGPMGSGPVIFVCGSSDISNSTPEYTKKIIVRVQKHSKRCPGKTFYFQSKRPKYFQQFLADFPDSVVLLTTLETNRDAGYDKISKAPVPSVRYQQFKSLDYPRKAVTIEPVVDFDEEIFLPWLIDINPEYVWLGFDSHPKYSKLPEPSEDKFRRLARGLKQAGIQVKGKSLRGVKI